MSNRGSAEKFQVLQDILAAAVRAKETSMTKRLSFRWRDKEINMCKTPSRLVGWITSFKVIGGIAVEYGPVLPWAGVRFILLIRRAILTLLY